MNLLPAARQLLPDLQRIVREIPFEQKGVLFSEMLFLGACLDGKKPTRIIESGRARGQSTHVLALMFPDTEIASIEYDANSPDCPIAAQRLAPFKNVRLLFGDSTKLIPEMLREGDVVLIDGPKHFRAIRLALQLMVTGKPEAVFIHDVDCSVPERHYLDRGVPGVLYSDDDAFVKEFRSLDDKCWPVGGAHDTAWEPYQFGAGNLKSYGPTMGCLRRADLRVGLRAWLGLEIAALKHRLGKSFAKRIR
jgi:hypothetical protein